MDWLQVQTVVNLLLQQLGGWLLIPMQFFSYLGTEEFFMIFLPLIFWSIDIVLGIRIGFILLLSSGINHTLKIFFHTPRPYWIDPNVKALAVESSYGLPSGHAQIAAGLWGLVGYQIHKKSAVITAVVLIFLIGLSRLYLGVHFLTDVLLGWLLGGLTLWLYLRIEPHFITWVKKLNFQNRVIWSVASSLIILVVFLMPNWFMTGWQPPNEWQVNAGAYLAAGTLLDPLNTQGVYSIAGTWLGITLGIAWMYSRQNGYVIEGSYTQKTVRYLVGVAGLLAIRFGLKMIFPGDLNLLGDIFRIIRYTMMGLWISVFAPLIFMRIGLAKKTKKGT
jgi:membrane-associated phospholipid phosphatase